MGLNSMILFAVTGSEISTALINTVMCITIVFLILIFISFVISLFKHISKFENRYNEKNAAVSNPEPVAAPQVVEIEEEEEDLADDLELAAVITAAIYAYEESMGYEVPADGIVVRSIKKANKSRWQNA